MLRPSVPLVPAAGLGKSGGVEQPVEEVVLAEAVGDRPRRRRIRPIVEAAADRAAAAVGVVVAAGRERRAVPDREGPARLRRQDAAQLPALRQTAQQIRPPVEEPRRPQRRRRQPMRDVEERGRALAPQAVDVLRPFPGSELSWNCPVEVSDEVSSHLEYAIVGLQREAAAEIAPHFRREGVVARRHAVGHEEQHAEVLVDAVFAAIEQVAREAIHVVDAFEVDAVRAHVAEFHRPVASELALPVEEPALGVLGLDLRVHHEAGRANRGLARPALDAAGRVEAASELRVVRHRDVVKDLRADAIGWLDDALDGIRRQRARARDRLPVMRLERHAEAAANRDPARASRVPGQADPRREVQRLRRVEAIDVTDRRASQLLLEGVAGPHDDRREAVLCLADRAEVVVSDTQAQAEPRTDRPLVLDEGAGLVLREVAAKGARFTGLRIDSERLAERSVGDEVGQRVERERPGLRGPQRQPLGDPAHLESDADGVTARDRA